MGLESMAVGGPQIGECEIEVPTGFDAYIADTLVRFQYLNPTVEVRTEGQSVSIATDTSRLAAVKRDFLYCLYRQKIYAETISLRLKLVEGVMGK